jgi:hypothetical protein
MTNFRRIIPFLFLFALLVFNVAAQETVFPEPTVALVETAIPTVAPEPTAEPAPTPMDSATYEETIDGLITLIDTLVASNIDLTRVTGYGLTGLTIVVVLGWVFSKFTTTKKDDEFFEKLWSALRRPEIGVTSQSAKPKADG